MEKVWERRSHAFLPNYTSGVKCHGSLERHQKIGKLIRLVHKGNRSECTNYRGISLLCLPGRVPSLLKKDKAKKLKQKWRTPSAVVVAPVELQNKSPLFSKFSRNSGSMPIAKDLYTCFVDLGNVYGRVPCEKLWGVLRELGVDGRLVLAVM